MATLKLDEVGHFTIKMRERFQSGSRQGLRPGWDEYQVWEGRKIVSRHERWVDAYRDAQARLQAHWDTIGEAA